ncbi:hypothetical protein [Brevibacillus brevis]|uniref:hypothetical protein n=1 Tax=Brevibacillus brevis TaxID=1393 RepID=UPI0007D8C956|nr:hypothetical protein [Brevibacillus brevis]
MLKFIIADMLNDHDVMHALDKMKESSLFKIEDDHIFYLQENKEEIHNQFSELTEVINDYGNDMDTLIDWLVVQTGKDYKLGTLTIDAERIGDVLKGSTFTDENSQIELFNSNKSILQDLEDTKKWAIGWLFSWDIGEMIEEAKENGIDLELHIIQDAIEKFDQSK